MSLDKFSRQSASSMPLSEKKEQSEQIIKNVGQDSVTLIKNTKGYNWEIKAYADSMAEAIDKIIAADMRLRNQFGGGY